MENICTVCLSSDRELFEVSPPLMDVIKMILPELEISELCWECLAGIKHLFKLRRKALKSKEILDKHLKENSSAETLESRSKLGLRYVFTFSYSNGVEETNVTDFKSQLDGTTEPKINQEFEDISLNTDYMNTDNTLNYNGNIDLSNLGWKELHVLEKNIKLMKINKRRVVPFKQFSCSDCNEVFESRGKYEYHKEKHRGKVQCPICSRDFSCRSALTVHHNVVHTAPPRDHSGSRYYCEDCAKFFKTNCSYRKHLRTSLSHIDPETLRFFCPVCAKRFMNSQQRDEHHERVHLQRNRLQCARCLRQYCSVRALRSHVKVNHNVEVSRRDLVCELCGEGFKTPQVLKGHQRLHTTKSSDDEDSNDP